jgi:hypothetical protein
MSGPAGNVRYRVRSGKHLLTAGISGFDPEETLWCHRLRSNSPAISVASTSNFGAQELWNRSVPTHVRHAGRPCCKRLLRANDRRGHGGSRTTAVLPSPLAPPQLFAARRPISVGDRRTGHKENIYRCRTAADWFVVRSERTSNSHIFGESHAVLVSCLRH